MNDVQRKAWKAVKLIHASQLRGMTRFPRYEDYYGITYHEYLVGKNFREQLATSSKSVAAARDRLAAIDRSDLEPIPVDRTLSR